jgi:hypothetical protein
MSCAMIMTIGLDIEKSVSRSMALTPRVACLRALVSAHGKSSAEAVRP